MSQQKIIGIAGRRFAGKDTAAAALIADGAENVKFAGALKTMLRAYLAYVGVQPRTIERMIEGDLKEVPNAHLGGRTPRYAMQTLGTEWGRDLMGKSFWIDAFTAHIKDKPFVVVTDMRFPNEVQHIVDLGGITIRITDPHREDKGGDEHPSEALVDTLTVQHEFFNDKAYKPEDGLHPAIRYIASQGEAA